LFAAAAARQIFDRPELCFPFAELAVATNQAMPLATVAALRTGLGGTLAGKRVALLGIAYREDVSDTRFTPAQTFVEALREESAEVAFHDPMVDEWSELAESVGAALPDSRDFDAIVLGVGHTQYRELAWLAWLGPARPLIVDANRVLAPAQAAALRGAGVPVVVVGSGT
jgi:UDP-N-acetyl-D-mannosaminuronate dehydrogenase